MSDETEIYAYYNQPLHTGILFWADQTANGERILYTNLKWYFTAGYRHEWRILGSASLRMAMEIVENVLVHEGYQGQRVDYGDEFEDRPGETNCFWMSWRVGYELRQTWLSNLSRNGSHTLDYTTIRDWIMRLTWIEKSP